MAGKRALKGVLLDREGEPAEPSENPSKRLGPAKDADDTVAKAKLYDPKRMPDDFRRWRQPVDFYHSHVLKAIDDWFEERLPKDRGEEDWLFVENSDGDNGAFQVIASMVRPTTRKTQGMLDGEKVVFSCDPKRNAAVRDEDCGYAGEAMTDIFRENADHSVGDPIAEMIYYAMLRGMYFCQIEVADGMAKEARPGAAPVRWTLHDPLDVGWDLGPNALTKRIILNKSVTWGQLTMEYKKQIAQEKQFVMEPAFERQMICWEYWDETHYACMINGVIVREMTEHGYGMCPFSVGLHQPTRMRIGMQGPRYAGAQPIYAVTVGRPVCEDLLQAAEFDSRLMTAMAESVKKVAMVPLIGKGIMLREDEDIIDAVNAGLINLEDNATSDVKYATPPDAVSNGLRLKAEFDKRTTDVAGQSPESLAGQTKERISGISQSDMQSWTRAAAEAIRTTIRKELKRRAKMTGTILAALYEPSSLRAVQYEEPELIDMLGDSLALPAYDGQAYPEYERLTGSKDKYIDGYTFAFIREWDVQIPPAMLFSIEQGHNIGLQISNLPPGRKLLSRRTILKDYMQVVDVDAEEAEVLTEELMEDQTLPLGKLLRVQAFVRAKAPELGRHYVSELNADIDRVMPQVIKDSIKAIVEQAFPPPALPGGAALMAPPNPMDPNAAPAVIGQHPMGGLPAGAPPPVDPMMGGGPPQLGAGPPEGGPTMPSVGPPSDAALAQPGGNPMGPQGLMPQGMPPAAMQ